MSRQIYRLQDYQSAGQLSPFWPTVYAEVVLAVTRQVFFTLAH
jgi:hypothetical protein